MMGRSLNFFEREARRRQKERERERNASAAERRRKERKREREREREYDRRRIQEQRQREAEKRAEAKQAAVDAAEAEYADWEETERRVQRIATPHASLKGVRDRLTRAMTRRPFPARQFAYPALTGFPAFNFESPSGPLANLVVSIRSEAIRRADVELNAGLRPEVVLSWCGRVLLGLAVAITVAAFVKDWAGFARLFGLSGWLGSIGLGYALAKLAPWVGEKHLARTRARNLGLLEPEARKAYEVAVQEASKRYESDRMAAQLKFEAEEAMRRKVFEKLEDARIQFLIGVLAEDVGTMKKSLQSQLDQIERKLPVACEITGRVLDKETVELAFMAPDADELPKQVAKLTKSGVNYREKTEAALSSQYRHVVNGIALRAVAEVFSIYPSVQRVSLDGYEERLDDSTGDCYLQCVINFEVSRAQLEKISSWDDINPVAVLESLDANATWKKGEFAECEPITGIRIETEDDFTPIDAG